MIHAIKINRQIFLPSQKVFSILLCLSKACPAKEMFEYFEYK